MNLDESSNDSQSVKSWKGISISELCGDKGVWSFNITPVTASKYHSVLYELPISLKGPPKPHVSSHPKHWDEVHVRMPFSDQNLFPVTEGDKHIVRQRWELIKETFSQKITNSRELEKAIRSYNNTIPELKTLHYFFEEVVEEEEAPLFFDHLFPKIVKLALDLPNIIPGSLPLLKKGYNRSVSLSQLQIASILANGFLCTFPWRKEVAGTYPGINFSRLFAAYSRKDRQPAVLEKLKCLFHYFKRVTTKIPVGVVTFERKFKAKANMHRWDTSELILGKTKMHINSMGTIEDDGLGFLQVDFANKFIGGGVLGFGCVQEEIRFVICPELLVGRLFVERLGDQEAVIVTGSERYSNYSGYGNSFTWEGDNQDDIPFDEYGRKRTTICIIDATCFNRQKDQYYPSAMLRELNKAYVGFSSRENENLSPVATGNWGCGAFRGNTCLKSLLQLMACTAAGRGLVYYTFGDEDLRDKFYEMYIFLSSKNVSIGDLWKYLCGFASQKIAPDKLYSFIQQSYFDSRKQPKSRKFPSLNFKKADIEKPCTSSGISSNDLEKLKPSSGVLVSEEHNGESQMDIDPSFFDDDDIILCTPPSEEKRNKSKFFKNKPKLTTEEIIRKLPKTNIAELIESIDETPPSKIPQDESFLVHIENMSKKIRMSTSDEDSPDIIGSSQEIIESSQKLESVIINSPKNISHNKLVDANNTAIGEAKVTKKLISDYFQKSFKTS